MYDFWRYLLPQNFDIRLRHMPYIYDLAAELLIFVHVLVL